MKCRRCDDELKVVTFEEDDVHFGDGNPRMTIEFECVNCGLEFDGIYQIKSLWCVSRGPKGGAGEIPIDLEEGRKLFE